MNLKKLLLCQLSILTLLTPIYAIDLINHGKSDYVISLEDSSLPTRNAAMELQSYLEKITGVNLPVVEKATTSAAIRLGGKNAEHLPADSIIIKTSDNDLILTGQGNRGTLYAVYTFLEDYLNVRFLAPNDTLLPQMTSCTLPEIDLVSTPAFAVREYWGEIFCNNSDYALKRKINGHWESIPDDWGGHEQLQGWCHTFDQILPAAEFLEKHPEWYAFKDGKRVHQQLCLSNREMRNLFKERLLKWLDQNPGHRFVSISQNDYNVYCECPSCLKLDARYGGKQSGILLDFVNEMAEAVEKDHPEIIVVTLAYLYSVQVPENIVPRDNVCIQFCTIEADVGSALIEEINQQFHTAVRSWSKITQYMFAWCYFANFTRYLAPHPTWRHWDDDLRLFRDNNTIWMFAQGGGCMEELAELRAYVVSKLLWNPDWNVEDLVDEFLIGYYGAGAPYIRSYMELMADTLENHNFHMICYIPSTKEWMPYSVLLEAEKLLRQAQEAVKGDARLEKHVLKAKLAINHEILDRDDTYTEENFSPERLQNALDEFCQATENMENFDYQEGHPLPEFKEKIITRATQALANVQQD